MTKLTIAVAAKGKCDPTNFLEQLQFQGITCRNDVEVCIAHDEGWLPPCIPLSNNISLVVCTNATSILKLWGAAIAYGNGTYIAVLDIHCPPLPGWFNRVIDEIERGTFLFFGPVDFDATSNGVHMLGYLAEYAQFHSPLCNNLQEVPGNNVIFRKDLLPETATLVSEGFYKTFLIWKLKRERGVEPVGFNDMRVNYSKVSAFRSYVVRRFMHGQCFAACRSTMSGQPSRLLCIGFTCILPLLRCWRIYKSISTCSKLRTEFFRFLPQLVLCEGAWSCGEFCGYLFQNKKCCSELD